MSRFRTIAVVVTVIVTMSILQLAAAETLGETRDQVIDDGDTTSLYDKQQLADDWYQIIVVWAPLIIDTGVILWAFAREYRRGRTTAARPPAP